jgi:hypothetical protein
MKAARLRPLGRDSFRNAFGVGAFATDVDVGSFGETGRETAYGTHGPIKWNLIGLAARGLDGYIVFLKLRSVWRAVFLLLALVYCGVLFLGSK